MRRGDSRITAARYTGFYKRLAADPATPTVFDDPAVAGAWPHAADPSRLAERTAWRNGRLAALLAHKRGQPA